MAVKSRSFSMVYRNLCEAMKRAPEVKVERWQGVDATKNPALVTHELQFIDFEVDLAGVDDLDHWRKDTGANIPWADIAFEERVCGSPLNPGKAWESWPWAESADKFRDKEAMFNISYAEMFWPRWPRRGGGGMHSELGGIGDIRRSPADPGPGMQGISYRYGDLQDLVELLAHEPMTRQAVIPLFHPHETGRGDGSRKMCSLLYNFIVRDGRLHLFYPMRSVDLRRHWRDDCYMAVRMMIWVRDRCAERNPVWRDIKMGNYAMFATSLHVFKNDHIELVRDGGWK